MMNYLLFFDIEYSNKSLECLGRLDTSTLSRVSILKWVEI